jgi:putative phosphoesterase
MRIGLLADTHGLVDPALEEFFTGCDLLLHAGDVGGAEVLAGLSRIAPARAVRGNNDVDPAGLALAESLREPLEGLAAVVIHELWAPGRLSPLARRALRRPAEIVVFGHSHRHSAVVEDGVLWVNPGSAGPRRFHLPRTAALLEVTGRKAALTVHDLERRGLPRLGSPLRTAL